jgi:hypothetical protein
MARLKCLAAIRANAPSPPSPIVAPCTPVIGYSRPRLVDGSRPLYSPRLVAWTDNPGRRARATPDAELQLAGRR